MIGPCIYGLCHPDTGELRYIGKANNPARRMASHMRDSVRRRTPVYDWIRSLPARPEMVILEAGCIDWRIAERRLIARARRLGVRLLNLAEGGDEPFCPIEVRRRNGAATLRMLKNGEGRKADKGRPFEEVKKGTLLAHYRWSFSFWKERGYQERAEVIRKKMEAMEGV